jgi:membrane fusion protein (multidrug efflux system)
MAYETAPKPKRARKWIIRILLGLVVLALIGGTGFMLMMKIKFADFQPPQTPPGVIVSAVVEQEFVDKIEAIGTAAANQSAMLTATVTETIKTINVNEGEYVEAGTVIVELNNDEERATMNEAEKSFARYDQLARTKIGSEARRDEERARLEVAKSQFEKRTITAPFNGVLGIRKVSVGDLVAPGTVITTIDEMDPIKLEFSVPEGYLSVLKPGLEINASSEAYPGQLFKGVISAIDSRVNTGTRAIMINARIPNADGRLRPGLLMKVDIVKSSRQALAIPEEAIVSAGEKKTVLVVGEDKKVTEKTITSGNRQAGYVEILSGLNKGEKVIIEGLQKAHDGGEVVVAGEKTIEQSMTDAVEYSNDRKREAFPQESSAAPSLDPQTTPEATAPATEPAADTPVTPEATPEAAPIIEIAPETTPETPAPETTVPATQAPEQAPASEPTPDTKATE